MIGAIGRAVWQVIHSNPADWMFLGILFVFGLVLLLVALWKKSDRAAVPVPTLASETPQPKLKIYSAYWGIPAIHEENVLKTILEISRDALVIQVENNTFKCDPVQNIPGKHVRVKYSYGDDKIHEVSYPEHSRLVLPEAHIIGADAVNNREIIGEATGIVAKRVRGDLISRNVFLDLTAQVYSLSNLEMPATEFDLLVDLHIVNLDPVPTTIQRFVAEVDIDGQWVALEEGDLARYLLVKEKDQKYLNTGFRNVTQQNEPLISIWDEVGGKPLNQNIGYRGWVAFVVKLQSQKTNAISVRMSVVDAIDRSYPVLGKNPMGPGEKLILKRLDQ